MNPSVAWRVGEVDEVTRQGDALVVRAARPMDGWRASTYRRTLVLYDEKSYAVSEARTRGRGCEYVLVPWVDRLGELPSETIVYDDDYVRAREEAFGAHERGGAARLVMLPLSPLLGFLPSRFKEWLQSRYGLDPSALTKASLVLELIFFVAIVASAVIGVFSGMDLVTWTEGAHTTRDAVVGGALLVDVILRSGVALEGGERAYGLGEWLLTDELRALGARVRDRFTRR